MQNGLKSLCRTTGNTLGDPVCPPGPAISLPDTTRLHTLHNESIGGEKRIDQMASPDPNWQPSSRRGEASQLLSLRAKLTVVPSKLRELVAADPPAASEERNNLLQRAISKSIFESAPWAGSRSGILGVSCFCHPYLCVLSTFG